MNDELCEKCGSEADFYRLKGKIRYLCDDCADKIAVWDPKKHIDRDKENNDMESIDISAFIVGLLGEDKITEIIEDYVINNYKDYEVREILEKNYWQRNIAIKIGLEAEDERN